MRKKNLPPENLPPGLPSSGLASEPVYLAFIQAVQALSALGQALQGVNASATAPALTVLPPALPDRLPAMPSASLPPFPLPVGPKYQAPEPVLLADLMNEFLIARARSNRSDTYLHHLHQTCRSFIRGRAKMKAAAVTPLEIEAWLGAQNWQARTQAGHLGDLRALYQFGMRRGSVAYNPAAAVEMPVFVQSGAVQVHSCEQVRAVLDYARGVNLSLCRLLAVRYFTGLRTSEARQISEADIHPDRGFIEISAARAKTRRRRLVTIPDNLQKWLALGGSLPVPAFNHQFNVFVKRCGVPWFKNVTRHSWVSYHIALGKNAAATAFEAGHSEAMLFSTYREVVTSEAAKDYFSIVPA